MTHIAVIGAGMAGLTLAHALQAAGRRVTVYEKSRGPGGRCSTRRSDAGRFDHGAPWLTAVTAAFGVQVRQWQAQGWVQRCDVHDPARPPEGLIPERAAPRYSGDRHAAWRGAPQMNDLGQRLAGGLSVRAATHIAAIERRPAGGWSLRALDAADPPMEVHDAVVVAVPAEQAAALLGPDSAQADAMRQTVSDPCWTVMASWPCALPLKRRLWRSDDPLAPLQTAIGQPFGRPMVDGERWVLHATAAWSRQNLDATPEAVKRRLLAALAEAAGVRLSRPSFSTAHRWRYAQVPRPHSEPCGWNPSLQLGACGDAWHAEPGAHGVERAWLSARALADKMLSSGFGSH